MIYLAETWCCIAATSGEIEELHLFAAQIGLTLYQFQAGLPRYEFPFEQKELAVQVGAIPVSQAEQYSLCWARFYRKHVTSISLAWYDEDYREKIGEQKGVRVRFNSNRVNGVRCYPQQYFNPRKASMRRILELAWTCEFRALYSMKKPRIIIQPYREDDS